MVWCLSERERGPAGSRKQETSSPAGAKESGRALRHCISILSKFDSHYFIYLFIRILIA
jgi:hypothetical protein